MGKRLFENNATGALSVVLGGTTQDTTITLQAGHGNRFPETVDGNYYSCTLVDASGNREIVKVTNRANDVLTVVRGQENTAVRAFAIGDVVEMRLTAEGLDDFLQASQNLEDIADPAAARAALSVAGAGDVNTFTQKQKWSQGTNVPSASHVTLPDDGNLFFVTGASTIYSIEADTPGTLVVLVFTQALTVVHGYGSAPAGYNQLILPTNGNASAQAGDTMILVAEGSYWRCLHYSRTGFRVSNNDTVPGHLNGKLVGSGQIYVSEQNNGGNESLILGINGDSLVQGHIANNAIGQGELKSQPASQSFGYYGESKGAISLAGGSYTMGWFVGSNKAYENGYGTWLVPHASTHSTQVAVFNTQPVSETIYVYSRYVQGSPPYDLGNGAVPLFIMALLDKSTKAVLATYVAEDPPWAYHGDYDMHPINGKLQRAAGLWGRSIKKILDGEDPEIRPAQLAQKLRQLREIREDPELFRQAIETPYTKSEKLLDMNKVPHLFDGYDPTKHIVALVDPVGFIAENLQELNRSMGGVNYADGSVSDLLTDGYLKVGEIIPSAATPPGVTAVRMAWKNTP